MAVLALFKGKGITRPMYEALRAELQWESMHAPGGLIHACAFDEAGDLHVADVWESRETMDAFVTTRLVPCMQKLEIPPPEVRVFPLHNLNVYPAAAQAYVLT